MPKGKLIVIEGGDGSGKMTQAEMLINRLNQTDQASEKIDFPRYEDNFYGQIIKAYLNGEFGSPIAVSPWLAGPLYCFDRFESRLKIKDWLEQGKNVVADRYHTANVIHQGAKAAFTCDDEFDQLIFQKLTRFLEKLEFEFLEVPRPDVVIYLHVYPEIARIMLEKAAKQSGQPLDGHEQNLKYAKQVEETALKAAKQFGWKVIECCQDKNTILSREKIHQFIWPVVIETINSNPDKEN